MHFTYRYEPIPSTTPGMSGSESQGKKWKTPNVI